MKLWTTCQESTGESLGRVRVLWRALEKEAMKKLHLQVHVYLISTRTVFLIPQTRYHSESLEGVQQNTFALCTLLSTVQEVFSHLKILFIVIKQPCPLQSLCSPCIISCA